MAKEFSDAALVVWLKSEAAFSSHQISCPPGVDYQVFSLRLAQHECVLCKKPIGPESVRYNHLELGLVHAKCLWDEEAVQKKKARKDTNA